MTASSPEELETLLEDALLLHDEVAVAALFEDRGVLVTASSCLNGRIHAAAVLAERNYVAAAHSLTVVRDVAVAVGDQAVNVSYRGPDQRWRLAVTVLKPST